MKRSFEKFCKDYKNIENYEKAAADNFKGWCCHHRLQTWNSDGERRPVDITREELIALGMYYNRPASELIFLTRSEHMSLHQKGKQPSEEHRKKLSEARKGKHPSVETRNKMSEAKKGKYAGEKHPMYGKHLSEEQKNKLSEAHKGKSSGMKGKRHSEETKNKIAAAMKGHTAWNKGIPVPDEQKKRQSEAMKGKQVGENHPFYGKHHTDETRRKLSELRKGKSFQRKLEEKWVSQKKENTYLKNIKIK